MWGGNKWFRVCTLKRGLATNGKVCTREAGWHQIVRCVYNLLSMVATNCKVCVQFVEYGGNKWPGMYSVHFVQLSGYK